MGILRTLLAYIVVFSHASETHLQLMGNDAGLAVLAFFVISGFYMSLITSKYHLQALTFSNIKIFYFSRFLRIYPLVWVCTIVTIIAGYFNLYHLDHTVTGALSQLELWRDKIFYLVENIFIFGQDLGRFLTFDTSSKQFVVDPMQQVAPVGLQSGMSFPLLGQAWTLSIEFTFYLLVPFLLTKSIRLLFIICGLSFALRYGFHLKGWGDNYSINHAFFPIVIGFFS